MAVYMSSERRTVRGGQELRVRSIRKGMDLHQERNRVAQGVGTGTMPTRSRQFRDAYLRRLERLRNVRSHGEHG